MDHVRRDVEIRQRIMSIYNKEEEDFPTKLDYDDYLEEREDIICNLVERIQVSEMEAKIAKYKQENGESIARNEARKLQRILESTKEDDLGPMEDGSVEHVNALDGGIHDDSMVQLPHDVKKQSREEWKRMACSSGWNPEMQRAKCIQLFSSSLHIIPAQ